MAAQIKYSIPCGIGFIAAGLLLRYLIGRRRFNRRNIAGLQQFPSYSHALWINFWERLVLGIARILIIAGGLSLAAAGFTHFKF